MKNLQLTKKLHVVCLLQNFKTMQQKMPSLVIKINRCS